MALRDTYWGRESGDEPDLRRRATAEMVLAPNLLSIFWRRRLVILACLVAALAMGAAYILFTTPSYLSSASILIDPRLGKTVGSDPVQPGFVTDAGAMDSQIKLFTSQTVLARVAKMANLGDDPEFNGSQRSLLDRILHPQPMLEGSVDLRALEEAVTIKRPERTYVVEIDAIAHDPKKAAAIANDVVQAYIDDQISSRVDSARDDSQFVRQKLDKLSSEIRDADDKVEAYKTSNNIVDTTGLRSNEQQITDLTRSLADARAKESDAQARFTEIDHLASSGHLDSASQALNSMTIERLRQQQAEAEQTEAKLATTLGPRHPELIAAKGRAVKAARLIRDELLRLKIEAQANYDAAKKNETDIGAQVDLLKGQSATMSQKLVPLEQLQRNAGLLRSAFARFSQVNDNLAQQETDSPPGRIISVARPSISPAKPKKTLALLIALSSGLFVGIAAALFAEGTSPPTAPAPLAYEPVTPPSQARSRPRRRYWDDEDDYGA